MIVLHQGGRNTASVPKHHFWNSLPPIISGKSQKCNECHFKKISFCFWIGQRSALNVSFRKIMAMHLISLGTTSVCRLVTSYLPSRFWQCIRVCVVKSTKSIIVLHSMNWWLCTVYYCFLYLSVFSCSFRSSFSCQSNLNRSWSA